MQKNLDKAVEVFDSIESHPSTRASGHRLPDAVTYEAMINVLVTLRRTDLMPEFLERLTSSGVHMTAYIANLLIKGFAANGDLDRAREVFESLSDPPVGVAAPNNHLPHEVSPKSTVAPGAPVFREVCDLHNSVSVQCYTLILMSFQKNSHPLGKLWFVRNWAPATVNKQ